MDALSDAELIGTIKRGQLTRVGGVALWTAELGAIVDGIAVIPRISIVVWGVNAAYAGRLPEGTQVRVRGRFKTDRFLTVDGDYLERTTFVVMRFLDPNPVPAPSAGLGATQSSARPSGTT